MHPWAGSGRQYPKIFVIIITCPLRCNFGTRFMSLQNSLFDKICSPSNIEETWKWYRLGGWYPGEEMQNKKLKNKYYYLNVLKKTPDSSCSHTTISGPQTQKLTSQNRHCLCWISATHLNHNFTLSYNLLLTQNNLQFSSDNFLYIYLTPDILFVKRIWQVNKKV